MSRTTSLLATLALALALAGCGDDGSPQPIDADPNPIDAPPVCTGGTLDYGDACTEGGSECGSCECHSFGHNIICTKTCENVSECPAGTRRCTGGYCQP